MPTMELRARDASGVAAAMRARGAGVKGRVREATRESGEDVYSLVVLNSPVDTGFMQGHVRLEFSRGGFAFSVGWRADDFLSAGLPFYVVFVIEGTRKQPPNDVLGAAAAEIRPVHRARLDDALRGRRSA